MENSQKLEENTIFQILDNLGPADRISVAATSKSSRDFISKHSLDIDGYINLFDYPMQAANGCITRNKLRGLNPVDCIESVTNSAKKQRLAFYDSRRVFTSAQLDVLIFNAIKIGNIPVLDELLQIRKSRGAIDRIFLQNAYCWAIKNELVSSDGRKMPIKASFLLNDFARLYGNEGV